MCSINEWLTNVKEGGKDYNDVGVVDNICMYDRNSNSIYILNDKDWEEEDVGYLNNTSRKKWSCIKRKYTCITKGKHRETLLYFVCHIDSQSLFLPFPLFFRVFLLSVICWTDRSPRKDTPARVVIVLLIPLSRLSYREKNFKKAWGGTGIWRGTEGEGGGETGCCCCCCPCMKIGWAANCWGWGITDSWLDWCWWEEESWFIPIPVGDDEAPSFDDSSLLTQGWPNDCQKRHRQYLHKTRVSAYSSFNPNFLYFGQRMKVASK